MNTSAPHLLDTFRQLLVTPDLAAEGDAGNLVAEDADIQELAKTFEMIIGKPCPRSLQPALLLPDIVFVKWKLNQDVSGEVQIANPFMAVDRKLDPSLQDWTLDGHQLANMRIADAVTDLAGPLHTLFEVTEAGISEDLFLFDSRELRRLELSYADYLDKAAASRGIIYWQYLFCERRVTQPMAQVLSAELDFLEQRFPGPAIDDLQQRLRKRSE